MSDYEKMSATEIRELPRHQWVFDYAEIIPTLCDRLNVTEKRLVETLTREAATRREVDEAHDQIAYFAKAILVQSGVETGRAVTPGESSG